MHEDLRQKLPGGSVADSGTDLPAAARPRLSGRLSRNQARHPTPRHRAAPAGRSRSPVPGHRTARRPPGRWGGAAPGRGRPRRPAATASPPGYPRTRPARSARPEPAVVLGVRATSWYDSGEQAESEHEVHDQPGREQSVPYLASSVLGDGCVHKLRRAHLAQDACARPAPRPQGEPGPAGPQCPDGYCLIDRGRLALWAAEGRPLWTVLEGVKPARRLPGQRRRRPGQTRAAAAVSPLGRRGRPRAR